MKTKQLIPLPPYDENVVKITGIYYHSYLNSKVNRKYVYVHYINGKRYKINYARFRVETYLGIKLPTSSQVHHINENPLDDRICNLKVLTISEHISLHSKKYSKCIKICPVCKKEFELTSEYQSKVIQGKILGKFCSKKCHMIYQWNWKKYNA